MPGACRDLQFLRADANVERCFPRGGTRMKIDRVALAVLSGLSLMTLAGCQAPEDRIRAACMANKLNAGGQAGRPRPVSEMKPYCDCVVQRLKTDLPPEKLKLLADRLGGDGPEAGDVTRMPQDIGGPTLQAMKSCSA